MTTILIVIEKISFTIGNFFVSLGVALWLKRTHKL